MSALPYYRRDWFRMTLVPSLILSGTSSFLVVIPWHRVASFGREVARRHLQFEVILWSIAAMRRSLLRLVRGTVGWAVLSALPCFGCLLLPSLPAFGGWENSRESLEFR